MTALSPDLFVHAAPLEAGAFASESRVFAIGVGKVAASVALCQRIIESRPRAVVIFGVAGAYPGGPGVGEACLVEREWLADEGVETPDGFVGIDTLGLGDRGPFTADPEVSAWLAERVGPPLPRVGGATVSLCSGTDARQAHALAACPNARVETMEGAAVAAVCARFSIPWAELRVISNRTGDRDRGGWDLPAALVVLHAHLGRLLAT